MPPTHFELQGRRVLVVEDEIWVAMDVEALLADHGCNVLPSARTIDEALEKITRFDPEIVVLDRNLNGQLTAPVAEALNRLGIPFVVMTGYVKGVADEPAMRHAPCVHKPWKPVELLDKLQMELAQHNPR